MKETLIVCHPARLSRKPCGWNTMFSDPRPPQGPPCHGTMPAWPHSYCPLTGGHCALVSCLRMPSCSCLIFAGAQSRRRDCRDVQDPMDTQGRKKSQPERNSKITPLLKEGAHVGQHGYSQQPAHQSLSGGLRSRAPP